MTRRIVIGATVAISLACAGAPAAIAAPQGGYAVFAQCPTHVEHVNGCLYAPVEGGYITLGRTVVPIARTVVLQGGLLREEVSGVKRLAAAVDGETLGEVAQTIPGGLFGSSLGAVTELAAPASSISLSSGVSGLRLALPIKVRLVNPLLGAECSVGSNAHPIELNLTTGTASGGLAGNPGTETVIEEGGIVIKSGVAMVSSGFAVPKAGGCGSALVDEVLDAKLGLPSSNNKIVFDSKIEIANSELVEESEG